MRKIWILSLMIFLILKTKSANTQEDYTHLIVHTGRLDLISHHPDFNPFSKACDSYWFDGRQVCSYRITFHLGYPILNNGLGVGLEKVGVPPRIVKPIQRYGLPLTFHVIQAARDFRSTGRYQLNLYDWIYDFIDKQPVSLDRPSLIGRAINSTLFSGFARP